MGYIEKVIANNLNLKGVFIISIVKKYLPLFILSTTSLLVSCIYNSIGKYDLAMAIMLSAVGLVIYFANFIKNKGDAFSPDGIFGAVWFFVIGIYQLELSNNQSSWSILMWFIVFSSVITYYLGSAVVELADRKFKHSIERGKNNKPTKVQLSDKISQKRMHISLVTAFFVSAFAFVIEVVAAGTVPILNKQFGNYTSFGLPYIHYLVISMGIILVLMYMYYVLFGINKILILLYITGWIILFSMLNRHVILFAVIGTLLVRHYMKKYFRLSTLVLLLAIALGAFALLGSLRQVSAEHLFEFGNFKQRHNYTFMWVYYYLTVGFTNLNNLVLDGFDYSFGIQTFTPLWTFTGIKGLFSYPMNPSFSGVGTYLEGIYLDFGIIGVIVYPFIMGLISKYFYLKLRKGHTNILFISISLCIINEFLFLFFSDYFSYTHIPLQIVVAAIIHFLSQKRVVNLFESSIEDNVSMMEANQ